MEILTFVPGASLSYYSVSHLETGRSGNAFIIVSGLAATDKPNSVLLSSEVTFFFFFFGVLVRFTIPGSVQLPRVSIPMENRTASRDRAAFVQKPSLVSTGVAPQSFLQSTHHTGKCIDFCISILNIVISQC